MTTATKHIRLLLFLSLCVVMVSCQDRDEKVEPTLEIAASENVEENPEIEFNYYFDSDTLNLEFQIKNNESKPIFFINNLWTFEFAHNGYVVSDISKKLRYNSLFFFEKELVGFKENVVEAEMSRYNKKDIYIIKPGKRVTIETEWLLDESSKRIFLENKLKYLARLVFVDHPFIQYEDNEIINLPNRDFKDERLGTFGYIISEKDRVKLGAWKFIVRIIEGKLEL
ncbi:MAG: hypothetical protein ACE364_08420 [Chlorobiota bacterium]